MSEIVEIARRLQEVMAKCDAVRNQLEEGKHQLARTAALAKRLVAGSASPAVNALTGNLMAASEHCGKASDKLEPAKKAAANFCGQHLGGDACRATPPASELDAAGTPSMVYTGGSGKTDGVPNARTQEFPYRTPPDARLISPGQPLDLDSLDENRKYLWVLDTEGNFTIADEGQGQLYPNRGPLPAANPAAGETRATHGDLARGPAGWHRGTARAGGELYAEKGLDGELTGRWVMDNDSSFTFNRTDRKLLDMTNLSAAHRLLGEYGTDLSRLVPVNTRGRKFD